MAIDDTRQLYSRIEETGVYPQAAAAQMRQFLRDEPVLTSLVLPGAVMDAQDGVTMELHVLAATRTRLVAWAGWEVTEDAASPAMLQSKVRTHPLSKIGTVDVTLVAGTAPARPEGAHAGEIGEDAGDGRDLGPEVQSVQLCIVLDALDRLVVRTGCLPSCGDECAGEHVAGAELFHEMLFLRESREGLGAEKLNEVLDFAATLSELVACR